MRFKSIDILFADSLGLLTAAAQVLELQDKLNSTLETLCQPTLLNIHLQQQLLATSQPSKELKPDVTGQIILQQKKKKFQDCFLHHTYIQQFTFVTLLEFLTSQQLSNYKE